MEEQKLQVEPFSFMKFVYPFLFSRETFEARSAAFESANWGSSVEMLPVWKADRFPQDGLLPHVARYLNTGQNTSATASLWTIREDALTSKYGLGGGATQIKTTWFLKTPQAELPFHIESVQVCLFSIGVGFITTNIAPGFNDLSSWFDFIHYYRFVEKQRGVTVRAQRREDRDIKVDFFPNPSRTQVEAAGEAHHYGEILHMMLATGGREDERSPWWDEIYVAGQLLPFVGIFVRGDMTDESLQLLAFRARHFFHSRQEIHHAPNDLSFNHPAVLSYGENQWLLFSLEGGSFFAGKVPDKPFFHETLPKHLQGIYYLIYIIALHQKLAMNMLQNEVAQNWVVQRSDSADHKRERAFSRIRDAVLAFSARGYFTQVVQLDHHHRYYQRWQEILQTACLYKELRDEVSDMFDYLLLQRQERLQRIAKDQEMRTRRLERLISVIACMVGLPILGLTFQLAALGNNPILAMFFTAGTLGIGIGIYFGAKAWINKKDRTLEHSIAVSATQLHRKAKKI